MKKILVIDDDPFFATHIGEALPADAYTVLSAENGEEGLKKAEEALPDLILLDIMMPKMNGMEFLKQFNLKYGKGKVPVLITSNMSTMKKISEGLELGIRGYIIKSGETFETIVDSIKAVFAKKA
ncbi:MAG: response regulator [Candidatus Taylorbacteria bacterium]